MQKAFTLDLKETTSSQKDSLVIRIYEQEDISMHRHNFFEFVYVMSGSTLHNLDGEKRVLKARDYFLMDYQSMHEYINSENFKLMNCLFLPELLEDSLKGCSTLDDLLQVCLLRYYKLYSGKNAKNQVFHDGDGRILMLLQGMLEEYEKKNMGYTEIFRSRLREIMILMMRNVITEPKTEEKSDFISKIISYIHLLYKQHKILQQFCIQYHYSSPYISRKFKEETGFTISEYLQKVRIEKSCELLSTTELSVAEVAEAVGYLDIKCFHQLFKHMIKMTPREYRKSVK